MTKRILAIDDDPAQLQLLQRGLKRAGFEVETARDGRDGLDKLKARPPDAVVLDLDMPELDGNRFLTLVKGHPATRRIPILVLSGRDSYESMRRTHAEGSDGYLTKPVALPQLIERLQRLMGE